MPADKPCDYAFALKITGLRLESYDMSHLEGEPPGEPKLGTQRSGSAGASPSINLPSEDVCRDESETR